MATYAESNVPDQPGKTFAVTGANTGIGYEAARVLAQRGARVLLACRSEDKGQDAIARIKALTPEADAVFVKLDLNSLASVREAAEEIAAEPQLDVLINNAGIMFPPRELTEDGFESQFGVNHLGHFALTGLLLPRLRDREGSRVVNVSSSAHRFGRMYWDDLVAEKSYNPQIRYGQSKLANLLFTLELQQRLEQCGAKTIAVACHPGGADTDLGRHMPALFDTLLRPWIKPFINSAAEGALPTLMAATEPGAQGNDYFGPAGFMEIAGSAKKVMPNSASQNTQDANRLWELSIEMTGIDPGI